MCSAETGQRRSGRLTAALVRASGVIFCLATLAATASQNFESSPGPPSPEVWLVTYGPGEIYWQRFGHNAIWIRDSGLGLDHVFNFGFFDFEQENFLLRFLQGRLLYFSAAIPAQHEFAQYMNENRSIRAQRLALSPSQALGLTDYLVNEVQPENRDYLYDYYWNNCSTRVRDALDGALGGVLKSAFAPLPAGQNFRQHTRRLTIPDYGLYLGLEIGLGSPVDQAISRWDEFFIPSELASGLARLSDELESSGDPLVQEDVMLFESTAATPAAETRPWWPRYLLLAIALLSGAVISLRFLPSLRASTLACAWLVFAAALGFMLSYLWFLTDHGAARNNLNLLLFNPLWLLCLAGRRPGGVCGWLVVGLGAIALLMTQIFPHQYTADVLAAVLPLNIAAASVLIRQARRPAPGSHGF